MAVFLHWCLIHAVPLAIKMDENIQNSSKIIQILRDPCFYHCFPEKASSFDRKKVFSILSKKRKSIWTKWPHP
jgi:hypothetical protein